MCTPTSHGGVQRRRRISSLLLSSSSLIDVYVYRTLSISKEAWNPMSAETTYHGHLPWRWCTHGEVQCLRSYSFQRGIRGTLCFARRSPMSAEHSQLHQPCYAPQVGGPVTQPLQTRSSAPQPLQTRSSSPARLLSKAFAPALACGAGQKLPNCLLHSSATRRR